MFAGFALQTFGLRYTTPARSGFITGLAVVIVPLIAKFLQGRRVGGPAWAGVTLAVVGLAMLTRPFGGDATALVQLGDLLTLGCAFAYAFQIVWTSEFSPRHSLVALTFVQIAVTFLGSLLLLAFEPVRLAPSGGARRDGALHEPGDDGGRLLRHELGPAPHHRGPGRHHLRARAARRGGLLPPRHRRGAARRWASPGARSSWWGSWWPRWAGRCRRGRSDSPPCYTSPVRRSPIELVAGELRVRGTGLYLDARRKRPCGFVSHAHADHLGRHERTIATRATAALARHRLGDRKGSEVLPADYRAPFGLGELTLELFSAGHVLGSAQIRITLPGGLTVGYTGDLCTEPTRTAEPVEVMPCDVLLMESTFGLPQYVFPPKEEVLAAVRRFVDDALSDGATPVLLGYSLGKAQEVLKHFGELGYPCRAHATIHAVNQVYEEQGVPLPNVRLLGPEGAAPGEIVVVPPQLARSAAIARIRPRRTAVLTGWALDGARWFGGVDASFPLSDHADFPSLLRYARATGASRVFTMHGHAARARQGAAARGHPRRAARGVPADGALVIELTVSADAAGQRLDKYVRRALRDVPLSHVYKMFRTRRSG